MATSVALARSTSRGSDFELAYASPTVLKAKGADRESLQRHDSKKYKLRGFNDEIGRMGSDGRNRRSRGSSDDEGNITPDGFSNEDLRVGGPYLCSIPADSFPVPDSHPHARMLAQKTDNGEYMVERIFKILRKHQVELSSSNSRGQNEDVELRLRRSQISPEPQAVFTLFISATRRVVDDAWLKAARSIYSLLRLEYIANVSVEIIDPQAEQPPMTYPILTRDPIFAKWGSVLRAIAQKIDFTDVQIVGCYRRGRSSDIRENPPTVLIIADVNSTKDWKRTRDSVVGILTRANLPGVAVEIVKDVIEFSADHKGQTGFNSNAMGGRASIGDPISNQKQKKGSGSLGGFVELQSPRDSSQWVCFALTCFHVIDPPDENVEARDRPTVDGWRKNGIRFVARDTGPSPEREAVARNLLISHPSPLAMKEQIVMHEETIDMVQDIGYKNAMALRQEGLFGELSEAKQRLWQQKQNTIDEQQSAIDNIREFSQKTGLTGSNTLGFVNGGASGFKLKKLHPRPGEDLPSSLDWALIRVDDKDRGDKKLQYSNRLDDGTILGKMVSPGMLKTLDTSPDDDWRRLHFHGYRSGRNQVRYNALEVIKVDEELIQGGANKRKVPTLAFSFTAYKAGGQATIQGDSGSLLFSTYDFPESAQVVGMIFAGAKSNHIGFFIRIDDLREDIKERTGAQDIRMYRA